MKHQKAREILQDRIIYLTGQITLLKEDHSNLRISDSLTRSYNGDIKGLKEAQEILKNHE